MSMSGLLKVRLALLVAIELYGKKWRKVEECVGTRTGIQIRSHAQKYFNKLNKLQNGQKKEKQVSNVSSSKIGSVSENELKGKSEGDVREGRGDEQKESREEQRPKAAEESPSVAAKENAPGNANPCPSRGAHRSPQTPAFSSLNAFDVNSIREDKKEEVMLGDKELYKELLRHAETVGSFRRVFETLKASSEADPLIDVELDQGRKILNMVRYKVQEQFSIKRSMQQLYECKAKLFKEIEGIQKIITELLLKHSDKKYFKQLFDTL